MNIKQFISKITFVVIAILLAIPTANGQNTYTINTVPNVHVKDKEQYLSDPGNFITPSIRNSINQKLTTLENKTGAEVAVVVLPSIGEEDCFSFAHSLFNHWGVGKSKLDNGLLILLVVDQRCVQFVTGYGLEGILPDITCKEIQVKKMVPYLKKQDWGQGIYAGVEAVFDTLFDNMDEGVVLNPQEAKTEDSNLYTTLLFIGLFLGVAVLFFIIAIVKLSNQRKCPVCKKKELQRINSRVIEDNINYRIVEIELKCMNCGHIVKRTEKQYKSNNRNRGGGGGGPVIFGPMGGGGSGRGFGGGGGSFGGGRSGGGGAGTRF